MELSKHPTQSIKKISELIEINLKIPVYQRPYKWKAENVIQLLDDIFDHIIVQKKNYRIGSLILHREDENMNIVDGQQRLSTISILLHCLCNKNILLLNENYKHKISKDNIVYNFRVINNWLLKISNKEIFQNKLLEKCEFVVFTVFKQEEAFQLFDSQNARGKALEPYDLLKAFHLREMDGETEYEKANTVVRWEKSIDEKTLKPILNNHLFKIRKWVKNEKHYNFTNSHIDEFKGISLNKKLQFPFEATLRILDGFVENSKNDKYLKNIQIAQSYPFSITMPIINGKRFFEYIDHYVTFKNKIFEKNDNSNFSIFYQTYCIGEVDYEENGIFKRYQKSSRPGDQKVRNLFENVLILYQDKFGLEEFENFYQSFYKAVYSIRCNNKSISLKTILNSNEIKILN
jgi:uncharacterized protein YqgQ